MLFAIKKDRVLKPIVLKNMQGHDRRNSKTTLMYTLALSFLIFAGTGFGLQGKVISDTIASSLGGHIAVITAGSDPYGLDEEKIREFFVIQNERDPSLL
jgi:hypothetical protein